MSVVSSGLAANLPAGLVGMAAHSLLVPLHGWYRSRLHQRSSDMSATMHKRSGDTIFAEKQYALSWYHMTPAPLQLLFALKSTDCIPKS